MSQFIAGITNHEARKQHQQPELLQLCQLAVASALNPEQPLFRQAEGIHHVHYRIHCACGIFFLEKLKFSHSR